MLGMFAGMVLRHPKKGKKMFSQEGFSSRIFAAVASLAVSAFVFAVAIMPANQGAVLPIAMA